MSRSHAQTSLLAVLLLASTIARGALAEVPAIGPEEAAATDPPRGDALLEAEGRASSAEATRRPATTQASANGRQLFFGDLHVHSSWSFDAYSARIFNRPADAYTYARGGPIEHVAAGEIRLAGPPLDFLALTEHAEYLGLHAALVQPRHPIQRLPIVQAFTGQDRERRRAAWHQIKQSYDREQPLPEFTTDAVIVPAWRALIVSANRHNVPGEFTTFVGFEYSPAPDGQNLHRNVLFRGDRAPDRPFSAFDSSDPEDLWAWMDEARAAGFDLLAIPHNPNGSNGQMFATTRRDGSPIDLDWIRRRARNEPAVEITQVKGTSETHPTLSPNDEWADFEIVDTRTTRADQPSEPRGSYVRDALETGLLLSRRHGENPYRLGMVGATDGHNASSPFEERNYHGKIGTTDGTPERRLATREPEGGPAERPVIARWGASGLTGVWASANERGPLFDAIRRRETFATTGPRIRVRLYGGFDFMAGEEHGAIEVPGEQRGVPMGGVLARSAPQAAPSFLIAAQGDPLDAPLERVQIVKGWRDGERAREKIFDVACAGDAAPDPETHRCPTQAADPDLATCEPAAGTGATELRAFWRDPEDRPSREVFYYARVLQIPTCRWSTWDALRLGRPPPAGLPLTIQERAYTSPIWVEPLD